MNSFLGLHDGYIYIGLTNDVGRTSNINNWYWLESGESVSYHNWGDGEPNVDGPGVHLWASRDFIWNDIGTHAEMSYICEKRL